MRELVDGIWHWTAFQAPISSDVSSYYVAAAGIVIDPKVPEEGFDALPAAPHQVVLTSGHHNRDAQQFADHFGIPIRASREADEYLEGALEIERFTDGDEIAPGVTSIHIGRLCDDEGALHLAHDKGVIAFADAAHRLAGELAFFPDSLLGDDPDRVKAGLTDAFRGLLTRDFDHLLFAHGDPLIGGGKSALREFVKDQE